MKRRLQGGVYALLIRVPRQETIRIGRLGPVDFIEGVYVYVGSALNSLEGRISRHFRTSKQAHWHVDFLLGTADVELLRSAIRRTTRRLECTMSKAVQNKAESSIQHFGCSDCECDSHLHHFKTFHKASKVLREVGFSCLLVS